MPMTEVMSPQLVRPGPIGLGIRTILGATVSYWFAALLTKWSGFLERDPIASGRLYTLFTIWLLPEVFALTFRRPRGLRPAVVFLAGGAAIGLAGYLTGAGVWNPVLAGWTYAGDLLVWAALAVSFPVAMRDAAPVDQQVVQLPPTPARWQLRNHHRQQVTGCRNPARGPAAAARAPPLRSW